ncbi:flagellar hook-basal body complex protein FliE [Acidisoma sp. C75]
MLSSGFPIAPSVAAAIAAGPDPTAATSQPDGSFLGMVDSALRNVSSTQNAAAVAESGFSAGAPGASLGQALVASDRAEIAWNATVSVRNEVVAAYQSVMNMTF